jgi:hypothetical protein
LRLFYIDIETCSQCGGPVKVIACIEDPVVMPKALHGAGSREATDPSAGKADLVSGRSAPGKPGATGGSVWLTSSNPSFHPDGAIEKNRR